MENARVPEARRPPSLAASSPFRRPSARPTAALLAALAVLASAHFAASPATAAEVAIFRQDSRADALAGEVSGASVGADGELRLAPHFERVAGLDEPFLFTAAPHPDGGAVLGTGSPGKLFRIDGDGSSSQLARFEEPSVFAVHVMAGGDVVAAGAPDGKVVRLAAAGVIEEIFDPAATYVWDLAQDSGGRLLVATGLPGRVYRLSEDFSQSEVIYESADRHVRTLLPRADGSLLIGTAGQGLVVELAADGGLQTLYDAAEPEVLAFAEQDGVLYVALLASEASQVDLSAVSGEGEAASGQETIGSRVSSYEGPRSRLVALEAGSTPRVLAELKDETVHTVAVFEGHLWLGTGQQGGLYRLEKDELILEKRFEQSQLIALMPDADSAVLSAATTDSVALHRFGGERQPSGTFTSRIHDAKHASRFGVLRWWGEVGGGQVRFEVRSGMAEKPDATWSDWQALPEAAGDGTDVAVGDAVGVARFAQWRATLENGRDAPRIDAVELSYRQLNQEPRITELEVLDHGEILVAQSFNPTSTTFEPWSPNRDGIFTRLRAERSDGQLKTLWKRGYRTLRFKAEDANGDTLRFALEVRRAGAGGAWLPVAEKLEQSWFSFDATVLPDGAYRFRLTASDAASNPHGDALEDQRRSEPVLIDHTPPVLRQAARRDGRFELIVEDALHPIKDAVYSIDAGAWRAAESADGLLDSRQERLFIDSPGDARLVLLRLTDAALNVVTLSIDQP